MRCTAQWPTGRVTAILSQQAVEVDGIPRHVADCRHVQAEAPIRDYSEDDSEASEGEGDEDESSTEEETAGDQNPWRGRLRQNVRAPERFIDLS